MRIALIVDEERLMHEHPMINRMTVGLISEGVRVVRVVPESLGSVAADEGERRIALATRVTTSLHVLPWLRRERRKRLGEALERVPADVVYAMGNETWEVGFELAKITERPLAIDIWSGDQIRRLPRGRAAAHVAAYVAPTARVAERLAAKVGPDIVCHVPVGVAVPAKPRRILENPKEAIAVAIIGSARDVPAYRALLEALSRVIRDRPQVTVFLELHGKHEHEIWRHAERLSLLKNVSAITDASLHRSLLMRCDLMLIPERYGEARSLVLEAMVHGMPVVAAADSVFEVLEDGETAALVDEADPESWARPIGRLLSEPETARALGAAGRARVAVEHGSSRHVDRLIDAFERIAAGGALPFQARESATR